MRPGNRTESTPPRALTSITTTGQLIESFIALPCTVRATENAYGIGHFLSRGLLPIPKGKPCAPMLRSPSAAAR